jgi:hypothetical protein
MDMYYTFALFVIPAKAGMTIGNYKIINISSTYKKVRKYSMYMDMNMEWLRGK